MNILNKNQVFRNPLRQYAEGWGSGRTRRANVAIGRTKNPTLKERLMAPAGAGAFSIGRGAVAGASAVGLGALCYYGLGMSSGVGIAEKSLMWPQYVRDRVRNTYMYVLGGLGFTALSAMACIRNPTLYRMTMNNSWVAILGTLAVMWGSGIAAQSIPYENTGLKHTLWAVHAAAVGFAVAPMCLLGGQILMRAAMYTVGIVGSLSTVAMCAPSEQFLNMGGPLAIGLGFVFAASIGSMFLPPTTALGAGLYSIVMYGGLILFSAFLLYDTQKIVKRAELHPAYNGAPKFDPINASIGLYLDILQIFIRMAMILSGGQRKK